MAYIKKFETDNNKYHFNERKTDIYNPEFNSNLKANSEIVNKFTANLDKWIYFVSYMRWNPDLFYDLITPETGGIRLDLDQRMFLRCMSRFPSNYVVFPRGYSKTMLQVMSMIHTAIFFPFIEVSMTAQTKENAAKLLEEKYKEIIKFYPLLKNEVSKASFSKDDARINFTNGSTIDILANTQSTKGARRKRLNVEESNLLNNALYEDVLEPIVNVPRRTVGKLGLVNPEELNGSINFLTTSGFRNSSEFDRNIKMVNEMVELKGKMVLGSSWELAAYYGRGETKSQILAKKEMLSPTFFAQNYCSEWVGMSTGGLIDVNKLMELRTMVKPEFKWDGKSEYIVAMDVARSSKSNMNQSSIVILKVRRSKNFRVSAVQVVNLFNLPNGLNFSNQTQILKRTKLLFNAKVVVVDGAGLGKGIIDECLKETYDSVTGDYLGCWDTINTEQEPESEDHETCLFELNAAGINHDIIVNFIDMVDSKKLQLLEQKVGLNYLVEHDINFYTDEVLPYLQTDFLIDEISNLKLKQNQNGRYSVEQNVKIVDKDRYSALVYGLYYIRVFEDVYADMSASSIEDYCFVN